MEICKVKPKSIKDRVSEIEGVVNNGGEFETSKAVFVFE